MFPIIITRHLFHLQVKYGGFGSMNNWFEKILVLARSGKAKIAPCLMEHFRLQEDKTPGLRKFLIEYGDLESEALAERLQKEEDEKKWTICPETAAAIFGRVMPFPPSRLARLMQDLSVPMIQEFIAYRKFILPLGVLDILVKNPRWETWIRGTYRDMVEGLMQFWDQEGRVYPTENLKYNSRYIHAHHIGLVKLLASSPPGGMPF